MGKRKSCEVLFMEVRGFSVGIIEILLEVFIVLEWYSGGVVYRM